MKSLGWNYGGLGASLSGLVAAVGTGLNWWLGGWDLMVQGILVFMAMDFVLGFLAAAKNGSLDSRVMFWGGLNKLLVLGLVGAGAMLDRLTGLEEPMIRTAVIWFYIGREGLSVVENYGKLGMRLPAIVVQALAQMKQQGGDEI